MRSIKTRIYLLFACMVLFSVAQEKKLPDDVLKNQSIYKAKQQSIKDSYETKLKVFSERYIKQLEKLQVFYMSSADLDSLLLVKKDLKLLNENPLSYDPKPETTVAEKLKKLQSIYLKTRTDYMQSRLDEEQKLSQIFLKVLDKLKQKYTKSGDIDTAIVIRDHMKRMQDGVVAVQPDTIVAKPPAVYKGEPVDVKLYASTSTGSDICVNGKVIIKNAYREKAGTALLKLKPGDLITVRCSHRFDITSVWLNVMDTNGNFLFGNSENWFGYLPANDDEWWKVPPGGHKSALAVEDRREYTGSVKSVAKSVKGSVLSQPIVSPLNPGNNLGGYLFYKVKAADLQGSKK